MLSFPQSTSGATSPPTGLSTTTATGWQDSGVTFTSSTFRFVSAYNGGSNDVLYSFDKINFQRVTSKGSASLPFAVSTDSTTKLWLMNATNGSACSGLEFTFAP